MTTKRPLLLSDFTFGGAHNQLTHVRKMDIRNLGNFVLQDLLIQSADLARRQRTPWRERMFYPIVMPLNEHGEGPASEEKGEIRKLTWEVWDQACLSHHSFPYLIDAVISAERMHDIYGLCYDEGCPEFGTPHSHTSLVIR